jgi:hypothetical protein
MQLANKKISALLLKVAVVRDHSIKALFNETPAPMSFFKSTDNNPTLMRVLHLNFAVPDRISSINSHSSHSSHTSHASHASHHSRHR